MHACKSIIKAHVDVLSQSGRLVFDGFIESVDLHLKLLHVCAEIVVLVAKQSVAVTQ
jgi:hypothetical protein